MSSVANAALSFFVFVFAGFSTSPDMDDVTMRIGFYVLNAISMIAVLSVFVPWFFARKNQNKRAAFFAFLPLLLICLAVVAFLTLDSWLGRTFS